MIVIPTVNTYFSSAFSEASPGQEPFFSLVASTQGRRLDDQRASTGGSLPGLRLTQHSSQAVLSHLMASTDNNEPDDQFFDMLVKCQVNLFF